jgi:hypothetical protein
LTLDDGLRAVVLVEGVSDQVAVETLAARRGVDLGAEAVGVVPIGGAHSIGRFLARYGPDGLNLRLAGLVDAGEAPAFRRAIERAGLGGALAPGGTDDPGGTAGMERLGFFVCDSDLEAELIRALGVETVMAVIAAQGELASFRTLQLQPAQRGRPVEDQLHRFMGTKGGRKIQYASALVDALDLAQVPRPLAAVLDRAVA